MSRAEKAFWSILLGVILLITAEAGAQAISKAVLYVRKLIGLGGEVEVVGSLRASPIITSTVHTADGGLLVLDGGGVVLPCAATLPTCSATVNRGVTVRECSTDELWTCSLVTPAIGYAWQQDGPQVYTFASKSGIGGVAVPQENQIFSSSTPAFVTVTVLSLECGITLAGSGAGQAVLVAVQDGGTKCRFNFPCSEALDNPVPLDGGYWQGAFICAPNEIAPCIPPGPCAPTQVYYHADSDCAMNGLPGITCDAFYRSYRKAP